MADESTRWEGIVGYDAGYRQSDAWSLRPSDEEFLNFADNPPSLVVSTSDGLSPHVVIQKTF